ncbi:hypothetical protein [Streptomyces neyagawaensis]|uniref:hypothetical protein n=1 Tax=Streptomyces neyagawaensis TaxID=42238 RepID=UPI0006E14C5D|nr:hypothetical protein [Streptomyces neyagawaensis]MCL6737723.1 hypothetical protein [Streptomyces neyagawaensis]MDE1687713.1 hypothetical protein [Streptomyces neyagawaensis]MDG5808472.1 hypothetical protein [Streptomyces ossamyceticus]
MTTPPSSPSIVHQQRLDQLAAFLRTSEQVLASWDVYSDQHTDPDGWPYDDETYGQRAARQDADTWQAAAQVRPFARELLSTAEDQLQQLPAQAVQTHWPWHLASAEAALDELDAFEEHYRARLDDLPPSAHPGTEVYDDLIDARNAEAWHALDELALHAPAILAIHTATRNARPRLEALAPRPAPSASGAPEPVARR